MEFIKQNEVVVFIKDKRHYEVIIGTDDKYQHLGDETLYLFIRRIKRFIFLKYTVWNYRYCFDIGKQPKPTMSFGFEVFFPIDVENYFNDALKRRSVKLKPDNTKKFIIK